jgi:hypothetical protein
MHLLSPGLDRVICLYRSLSETVPGRLTWPATPQTLEIAHLLELGPRLPLPAQLYSLQRALPPNCRNPILLRLARLALRWQTAQFCRWAENSCH